MPADSPYFDGTYFDPDYFDTGATSGGRHPVRQKPPEPLTDDLDELLALI